MNRIDETLKNLTTNKLDTANKAAVGRRRKILSPYITAGDPDPNLTLPLMHGLVEAGADLIELGIPFSDPMAEGPVIQKAMERALAHKITIDQIFAIVKAFRTKNPKTPIVLMGYLNPIEQYGYEKFAQNAHQSGVDGTILVDLPPEESDKIEQIWEHYNLYCIYLCSLTTSQERLKLINKKARGYIYFVSLKGVTGAQHLNILELQKDYEERKKHCKLPMMVGFGIKTPQHARDIACFADGVIIGAALIETIFKAYKNHQDPIAEAVSLIKNLRNALD